MLTLTGEEKAYEALVLRYQKAVLSAANAVLHNRCLAEDAAQDAFVAAWMKLDVLRQPEKFGGWVCRIAGNCAKNMAVRFREYLSLDALENYVSDDGVSDNLYAWYAEKEETERLHESLNGLPERVRRVIRMYYFEDLSVAEIARQLGVTAGTVKSQLFEGRRRMRKELSAVSEQINDTLVRKVMKKVEELKLWELKNSKEGFSNVYREVLSDVEALPESADKYHAMADVLMRGWWWLPGEKHDALFARVKEAAERGKNEEAMAFIMNREASQFYGNRQINYIRNMQIPYLASAGFVSALARQWFWLGKAYFQGDQPEKGFEALEKAQSLLDPSDFYHAYALATTAIYRKEQRDYVEVPSRQYLLLANSNEMRTVDGEVRFLRQSWSGTGYFCGGERSSCFVLRNAGLCDGHFTVKDLCPGQTYTGSDGTTLTFEAEDVSVQTSVGQFTGCQVWTTAHHDTIYRTYWKAGVGIVRQQICREDVRVTMILKDYHIVGGEGLLPMVVGNTWSYEAEGGGAFLLQNSVYKVDHAANGRFILGGEGELARRGYDDNKWLDMIDQIRNDYMVYDEKGNAHNGDIAHAMERAEALASTPVEKAHTAVACTVARRILDAHNDADPGCMLRGHWNFFRRSVISRKDGGLNIDTNFRWNFERKHYKRGVCEQFLYNDLLGILQDCTGNIWSDDWKDGYENVLEFFTRGSIAVKTTIRCKNASRITTSAGDFDDCICVSLDTEGFQNGLSYRNGKKEYYFAPGVGIVRAVFHYFENTCFLTFDLTAYPGTGEGYMPLIQGERHYSASGTTDGCIIGANYTFVTDEAGRTLVMEDLVGVRKKPEKLTRFSDMAGEIEEVELWKQGKKEESHVRAGVNNLNMVLHYVCRPMRHSGKADMAMEGHLYKKRMIEAQTEDGQIPDGWLGLYDHYCFAAACASFGAGKKEQGYVLLDLAIEICEKWSAIPDGTALSVGNQMIFGGVKLCKGNRSQNFGLFELPDGTREVIRSEHYDPRLGGADHMYCGMTAAKGWEWFNSVRDEKRFAEALARVKKMIR